MAKRRLTLAVNDYEHVRDLVSGAVQPNGIELTCLVMSVEEIFYRFAKGFEWDVSELSFAKYCSLRSLDAPPVTGIPVFPSRMFRHSAFYVRSDGSIARPEDLRGRRVGIPEWTMTATVYARGWLTHEVGIPLTGIEWVQAGMNEPGRVEMAELDLPEGVRYTPVPDRALDEMLLAGEIDAIIAANAPRIFREGHPGIARLYPDHRPVEEAYFRATGIFPIMHTIAIRRDVFEADRWIAMNLLEAFEEAKRRSVARIFEVTASQIPVPWGPVHAAEAGRALFGEGEFWPYGIEPNRITIDAFLQYAYEQGVCHRRLRPEDLYPEEVRTVFKV